MITFKYKYIETLFNIDVSQTYYLVIENTKLFVSFMDDITNNNSETLFLSKDYKEIDFKKNALVIENLLNFEINSKKMLSTFYNELESKYLNHEKREIIDDINALLSKLLLSTKMDISVPIDSNEIVTYKDLLTVCELKIVDDSKSLLERLVLYLHIQKQINDYKLLFIPFLDSYFDESEIKQLVEELKMMNVCLFIVTSFDRRIKNFNKVTIDKDLCEI